jgi:hypothetical protein
VKILESDLVLESKDGFQLYRLNPDRKWWQFWKPKELTMSLCPHMDDWDDCPVCRH